MKLTFRVTTLLVLVLAAAAIASADGVGLTLNNGGNYIMGGVYVGPYNFTTSNGQSLQLICDDFKDDVYSGESWNATTSTVSNLGNVMFSGSTQYKEVAWLVGQMLNSKDAQTVGEIQWAIWAIFDPAIVTPGWTDPWGTLTNDQLTGLNLWYGNAQAACGSGTCDYPNFTIYTPPLTGAGQPQEYLGIIPTPEPSSLALLFSGMLAMMLLVIRRSRI